MLRLCYESAISRRSAALSARTTKPGSKASLYPSELYPGSSEFYSNSNFYLSQFETFYMVESATGLIFPRNEAEALYNRIPMVLFAR